jgi:HSP20 family protein
MHHSISVYINTQEYNLTSQVSNFYVGDVKNEDVTAKYDNGILTVELPKKEEAKQKKHNIEIQ